MEIERKFLVGTLPKSLGQYKYEEITQGYISTDPVIRLRKSNDAFWLTIKTTGHLKREEVEFPLTEEQFQTLWLKIDSAIISKTRFFIPLKHQLVAEVDIYKDTLEGLFTIEVEFDSEKDAENFIPPAWFGKDITHDSRYKNNNLSLYGKPSV